jgi:hypothetical protein
MINRVGNFFILIGLFLIGLFVLSDVAKAPTCGFFITGALSLGLGIFLWFKNPRPPSPPSGRFRVLKNRRGGQEEK